MGKIKHILQSVKHLIWNTGIAIATRTRLLTGRRVIHVIGDSHTLSFQSPLFVIHHIGPATAFKMSAAGSTTKGREKVFEILNSLSRKRHHDVLFVLGEIDCRIHINKVRHRSHVSLDSVIASSVKSYGSFLVEVKKAFPYVHCMVLNVLPPGEQENIYHSDHYPSRKLRLQITMDYNARLKAFCGAQHIPFISLFDELIEGKLKQRKQAYIFEDAHYNKKIVPLITIKILAALRENTI